MGREALYVLYLRHDWRAVIVIYDTGRISGAIESPCQYRGVHCLHPYRCYHVYLCEGVLVLADKDCQRTVSFGCVLSRESECKRLLDYHGLLDYDYRLSTGSSPTYKMAHPKKH